MQSLPGDWLFLLADPGESVTRQTLASLDAFSGSVPVPPGYAFDAGHCPQSFGTDPFACLPPEVLDSVLVRLPSGDVCRLRLASGAVARISSPTSLSQSFWESRFTNDFEMAFFAADSPTTANYPKVVNWRALYALIRASLGGGPLSAGLQNRRRIWNCLTHVSRPLEPLLRAGDRNWLQEDLPAAIDPLPEGQWRGNEVQSHAKYHRASRYLPLRVSLGTSRLRISVYFIEINCRRYVSGVALRCRDGDELTTLQQVGISTTTEEHLEMDEGEVIYGMQTYCALDGVVGFDLYLRGGKSRNASLGHCLASYTDIAVAELLPTEPGVLCGLIFAFDVRSLSNPRKVLPID